MYYTLVGPLFHHSKTRMKWKTHGHKSIAFVLIDDFMVEIFPMIKQEKKIGTKLASFDKMSHLTFV